jgi:hypothetical protein
LSLVENRKSIETIGANSKIQIEKYFNEIRESIKKRETELLTQIDSVIDRELTDISAAINACADKREKIESVSRMLNSVRDSSVGTGAVEFSTPDREIDVLESFAEMKAIIRDQEVREYSSSRAGGGLELVQLYVPADAVVSLNNKVREIKSSIEGIRGLVPSRPNTAIHWQQAPPVARPTVPSYFESNGDTSSVPSEFTNSVTNSEVASSVVPPGMTIPDRKRRARRASTTTDIKLMAAIDNAVKSG